MGLFNSLLLPPEFTCERCGAAHRDAQFRFGHTRQLTYRLGEAISWLDGNAVGEPGHTLVVLAGWVPDCPPRAGRGASGPYDGLLGIAVHRDVLIAVGRLPERFLPVLEAEPYLVVIE